MTSTAHNGLSKSSNAHNDPAKKEAEYTIFSRSTLAQVLATFIQNWLLIIIGLVFSMDSIVIGALYKHPNEKLNMDDNQASWFGSIPSFCHPIGSLMSGMFQEKFGRRGSTVLINIPIFAAWLLLYFANSISTLYVVSTVMGLSIGLAEAPLHAYIGEIADPHMRGTLSTISTSAAVLGSFIMFSIGYLFEWRTAALVCSAFPAVGFFLMTQIPESPSWLIVQNRLEDAKKSLCWLRGWAQSEEIEEEFQKLVNYTINSAKQRHVESEKSVQSSEDVSERFFAKNDTSWKAQLRELTDKRVLRPLRMVFIVLIFSNTACLDGIRPYLVHEVTELGSPIDSKLILMMSMGFLLMGSMTNVVFLRRIGKRKIAIFSSALAAIAMFGIGVHCSFRKSSRQYSELVWIPFVLFFIVNFLSGFSSLLLPWQLVCEVFPHAGRGTATGISAAWNQILDFAMIKSFLYIQAWVDLSGVMCIYGAGTALGAVYYYFYLPETEGKTLAQIESYFTDDYDQKENFSIGKSAEEKQNFS